MGRDTLTFDQNGFPVELVSDGDIRKAIRSNRLRAHTLVRIYSPDGSVSVGQASTIERLRPFFDLPDALDVSKSSEQPVSPSPAAPGHASAAPSRPPPRPQSAEPPRIVPRGANMNLADAKPGLAAIFVGLGWKVPVADPMELDAIVFVQGAGGKVRGDEDVIFYNNRKGVDGAVEHLSCPSEGADDAQMVKVDLSALPDDVEKMSFAVAIYDAERRNQNFRAVSGAYIRIVDAESGAELARSSVSEVATIETAMIFGEIYRRGGAWKFKTIGQGFKGGLAPLAKSFGVNVLGE